MDSHGGNEKPHVPPPSVWPIGFAVGVVSLLVGLVVSLPAAAVGFGIAAVFGFLWVRDATREHRTPVVVEPERREVATAPAIPADQGEAAMPQITEEEVYSYPRSVFLENATLGLGAVIGGLVTLPVLGFAILPSFTGNKVHDVDVGPIGDFPEGQFVVTTFTQDPSAGEVSRRTAYIRNNGPLNGKPSFTAISNRCAHLGCPVQPNGPIFDNRTKNITTKENGEVRLIPTQPAGFGCPCHGGQYDTEGNRIAGPPVRGLDRFEFSIRNGHLWLGQTFSVAKVLGAGSSARIHKYPLAGPGQHVDGPEAWFYPVEPPR